MGFLQRRALLGCLLLATVVVAKDPQPPRRHTAGATPSLSQSLASSKGNPRPHDSLAYSNGLASSNSPVPRSGDKSATLADSIGLKRTGSSSGSSGGPVQDEEHTCPKDGPCDVCSKLSLFEALVENPKGKGADAKVETPKDQPQPDWRHNPPAIAVLPPVAPVIVDPNAAQANDHPNADPTSAFVPFDAARLARCHDIALAAGPINPATSPIGVMTAPFPAMSVLRHHFVVVAPPKQRMRINGGVMDLIQDNKNGEKKDLVEYVYQPRNCWDIEYARDAKDIQLDSAEYVTGCAPYKRHAKRLRQFIDCSNTVFKEATRWDDTAGKFLPEQGKNMITIEREAGPTQDDYAEFSVENPSSLLQRMSFLALMTSPDRYGTEAFFEGALYADPESPSIKGRLELARNKLESVKQKWLAEVKQEREVLEGQKGREQKDAKKAEAALAKKERDANDLRLRQAPVATVKGKQQFRRPVGVFNARQLEDTTYDYEHAYLTDEQEQQWKKCFGAPGSKESKKLQHALWMYSVMMGAVGQLTNGLTQHDNYYISGGETPEHFRGDPGAQLPQSEYVVRVGTPAWCARKASELVSNFAVASYARSHALVSAGYLRTYDSFDFYKYCSTAHDRDAEFSKYGNCRVYAQCWLKAAQRVCAIDEACCPSKEVHAACVRHWDSVACHAMYKVIEVGSDSPYPRQGFSYIPLNAQANNRLAALGRGEIAKDDGKRVFGRRSPSMLVPDNPYFTPLSGSAPNTFQAFPTKEQRQRKHEQKEGKVQNASQKKEEKKEQKK